MESVCLFSFIANFVIQNRHFYDFLAFILTQITQNGLMPNKFGSNDEQTDATFGNSQHHASCCLFCHEQALLIHDKAIACS